MYSVHEDPPHYHPVASLALVPAVGAAALWPSVAPSVARSAVFRVAVAPGLLVAQAPSDAEPLHAVEPARHYACRRRYHCMTKHLVNEPILLS